MAGRLDYSDSATVTALHLIDCQPVDLSSGLRLISQSIARLRSSARYDRTQHCCCRKTALRRAACRFPILLCTIARRSTRGASPTQVSKRRSDGLRNFHEVISDQSSRIRADRCNAAWAMIVSPMSRKSRVSSWPRSGKSRKASSWDTALLLAVTPDAVPIFRWRRAPQQRYSIEKYPRRPVIANDVKAAFEPRLGQIKIPITVCCKSFGK